jgi:hypothetical protein
MPRPLRVDDGRFPSETLDGETVVIDTLAGRVTVFDGVATAIWELFRIGADADVVEARLVDRYGSEAAAPVRSFVDALAEESMVRPVDGVAPLPADVAWPDVFRAPAIEQYDELAELLTVDPIHDVDPAVGWPRAE